jgi:hypothetical protein
MIKVIETDEDGVMYVIERNIPVPAYDIDTVIIFNHKGATLEGIIRGVTVQQSELDESAIIDYDVYLEKEGDYIGVYEDQITGYYKE